MGIYWVLWGFEAGKCPFDAHESPCFPERVSEMPIFSGVKKTHNNAQKRTFCCIFCLCLSPIIKPALIYNDCADLPWITGSSPVMTKQEHEAPTSPFYET